jgi:nucleotide-binding universal stress UspA family protein
MLHFRRILHPTDFSDSSRAALDLAARLARESGAGLVVVHVAPTAAVEVAGDGIPAIMPAVDLGPLRERLEGVRPEDAGIPVRHRLLEGDPATEVLREARADGCDLIVLGTHGRTGVSRFVLGSVAEQITRRAPCPVVVVKKPMACDALTGPAEPSRPESSPAVLTPRVGA